METRLGSHRCRSGQLRWGRWRGMASQVLYSTALWRGSVFFLGRNVLCDGEGGLNIKMNCLSTLKDATRWTLDAELEMGSCRYCCYPGCLIRMVHRALPEADML